MPLLETGFARLPGPRKKREETRRKRKKKKKDGRIRGPDAVPADLVLWRPPNWGGEKKEKREGGPYTEVHPVSSSATPEKLRSEDGGEKKEKEKKKEKKEHHSGNRKPVAKRANFANASRRRRPRRKEKKKKRGERGEEALKPDLSLSNQKIN